MNRTETLAELKRLRDTGGTVGPWLLRDAIAALDAAERRVAELEREVVRLRTVPSVEAVQAAVEAMQANNEFLRDMCIQDEETDALTAVNNNAIAGLNGEGE